MNRITTFLLLIVLASVVAACGGANEAPPAVTGPPALDAQRVARGAEIYTQQCAECHGANLEGEANWQSPNPDGSFRAPPHDAGGHTWHHSDAQLIDAVRRGGARLGPGVGGTSPMPAYDDSLSDDEIAAVLDYIKSAWPADVRRMQWEISQGG